MENQSTGLFLEEEADLSAYRLALGAILTVALAPPATIEFIAALGAEVTS
ncbi:MAG: hypothetical protein LC799_19100 [Actinobacteria bacterium]|nr:hypothetical protein [Actinomycetota bacterium]